jgi:splicing factor 1
MPQVNQKLQLVAQGKLIDDTEEGDRSPSPEPVYNENGARINTREQRARDKLMRLKNVSTYSSCAFWLEK